MTGDSRSDEAESPANDEFGESTDAESETVSRRSFIRTAGTTAAAAGATAAIGADEAAGQGQTYRFGGEVAAWHPRWPAEDNTNPTVQLQAGTEYEFWFENLDGAPHNMTIQDAQGNAIVQSQLVTGEGSTASVTFTATPQMTQYICTVHPTTMVGDVEVVGEVEGGGGGLPIRSLVLLGGLALAFVSPLLFAIFLFSRDRGGETTA